MTSTCVIAGLGPVLFCHATPRSDEEIITRFTLENRLLEILGEVTEATIVCGHTHVQFDRLVAGKRLVNAGSVGMPYEGESGVACWALLGPGVGLRRSTYDVDAAAARIRSSGFPDAEEFVRKYVLEPPSADAVSQRFEAMGRERALRR